MIRAPQTPLDPPPPSLLLATPAASPVSSTTAAKAAGRLQSLYEQVQHLQEVSRSKDSLVRDLTAQVQQLLREQQGAPSAGQAQQLRQTADEAQRHAAQLSEVNRQYESQLVVLRARVQELEALQRSTLERDREFVGTLGTLDAKVEAMEAVNTRREAQKQRLEAELTAAAKANKILQQMVSALNSDKVSLSLQVSQHQTAVAEANALRAREADRQNQVLALEQRIFDLDRQLTDSRAEATTTRAQLDAAQADAELTRNRMSVLERQFTDQSDQLAAARRLHEEHLQVATQMRSELHSIQAQDTASQQHLESKLSSANSRITELEAALAAFRQTQSEGDLAHRAAATRCEMLEDERNRIQAELDRILVEYRESRDEVRSLRKDLDAERKERQEWARARLDLLHKRTHMQNALQEALGGGSSAASSSGAPAPSAPPVPAPPAAASATAMPPAVVEALAAAHVQMRHQLSQSSAASGASVGASPEVSRPVFL